jgi:hypothetical protein
MEDDSLKKRLFQKFDQLEKKEQIENFDPKRLAVRLGCTERRVNYYFKQRYATDIKSYRRIKRQKRQTNQIKLLMEILPQQVKNQLLELAIRYIQSGDYQFYQLMQKVYEKEVGE